MALCEFSKEERVGLSVSLRCELDGGTCGMYRFCPTIGGPKMSKNYYKYGCNIKKRGEEELAKSKKPKVEVVNDIVEVEALEVVQAEPVEQKTKRVLAKANFIRGDKTSVTYEVNGTKYGMFVPGRYSGNVEILYTGKFITENVKGVNQL